MNAPPDYGLGAAVLRGRPIVGFDRESYLIRRGRAYPRSVCLTLSGPGEPPAWIEPCEIKRVYANSWSALASRRTSEAVWRAALASDAALVAHNAAYDLGLGMSEDADAIEATFRRLEAGTILCTQVRELLKAIAFDWLAFDHRIAKKSPRYSLRDVVLAYFQVDLAESKKAAKDGPDPWRLRYHELDGVPPEEWPDDAVDYAIEDAEWAWKVAVAQAPFDRPFRSEDDDPVTTELGGVVDEIPQVRASVVLSLMAAWGLRSDPVRTARWGAEMQAAHERGVAIGRAAGFVRPPRGEEGFDVGHLTHLVAEHLQTLHDGDEPFRPPTLDIDRYVAAYEAGADGRKGKVGSKNTKALKALVAMAYEARGLKPPLTDKRQEPSTSEEALVESRDPALVAFSASAFASKMVSTYVPILQLGAKHAITSSPNVLVSTGRTSWRDPNLQNPPRLGEFRPSLRARDGMVFAAIDYDIAELCALAQIWYWLFGTSSMMDAINGGMDPHAVFGARLADVDVAVFLADLSGANGPEAKARAKGHWRQMAKVGNFGIPGGLGAASLSTYAASTYGVDMDEDAARELIREWKATWPESVEYFRMMGRFADLGDFSLQQFVSQRTRGGLIYTSGCNTLFQGLVADGAKHAGWELAKAQYVPPPRSATPERRALYGCRSVVFVHDEYIIEGPEETAHVWAPEAARIMVDALARYIPDVRLNAEAALMRTWQKGAEPVIIDGRLVPWEDRPQKK